MATEEGSAATAEGTGLAEPPWWAALPQQKAQGLTGPPKQAALSRQKVQGWQGHRGGQGRTIVSRRRGGSCLPALPAPSICA